MATMVPQRSTASTSAERTGQPWAPLQACVDWLLAGPRPQPDDIHNELLQQRTNKTRTLVVAVAASLLIASLSAALTGASWAYAWVLAEIVLGSTRIWLMMKALTKAKRNRQAPVNISPI